MPEIKVKMLDDADKLVWNKFVNVSAFGSINQFWEYGDLKKLENIKPIRVAVLKDKNLVVVAQILLKKVPFLGNYAYIPGGPVFQTTEDFEMVLPYFNDFLTHLSKTYDLACIEIEPVHFKPIKAENLNLINDTLVKVFNPELVEIYNKNGYQITGRSLESKQKIIYSLNSSIKEIEKTYSKQQKKILKAAKNKFVFKEHLPTDQDFTSKLEQFYSLLNIKEISFSYFKKLFFLFKSQGRLSIVEVRENENVKMMAIFAKTSKWSANLFQSSLHREEELELFLVNSQILNAKEYGSENFTQNLNSSLIPEEIKKINLGGVLAENIGILALAINPIKYALWDTASWAKTEGLHGMKKFLRVNLKKSVTFTKKLFKRDEIADKTKENPDDQNDLENTEKTQEENKNEIVITNIPSQKE